jgi:hypothetical protein
MQFSTDSERDAYTRGIMDAAEIAASVITSAIGEQLQRGTEGERTARIIKALEITGGEIDIALGKRLERID